MIQGPKMTVGLELVVEAQRMYALLLVVSIGLLRAVLPHPSLPHIGLDHPLQIPCSF